MISIDTTFTTSYRSSIQQAILFSNLADNPPLKLETISTPFSPRFPRTSRLSSPRAKDDLLGTFYTHAFIIPCHIRQYSPQTKGDVNMTLSTNPFLIPWSIRPSFPQPKGDLNITFTTSSHSSIQQPTLFSNCRWSQHRQQTNWNLAVGEDFTSAGGGVNYSHAHSGRTPLRGVVVPVRSSLPACFMAPSGCKSLASKPTVFVRSRLFVYVAGFWL